MTASQPFCLERFANSSQGFRSHPVQLQKFSRADLGELLKPYIASICQRSFGRLAYPTGKIACGLIILRRLHDRFSLVVNRLIGCRAVIKIKIERLGKAQLRHQDRDHFLFGVRKPGDAVAANPAELSWNC